MWPVPAVGATLRVGGGADGRDPSRIVAGRSLHRLLGLVLPLSLSLPAAALPPLVVAADVARPGLKAWVKPGKLMIGAPDDDGKPAICPLDGVSPLQVPATLDEWTVIGAECQTPPEAVSSFVGAPIKAIGAGDAMHPVVQLLIDGRPVAEGLLGRPANICALHIAEVDAIPGPELIAAWQIPGTPAIQGYTVYRIPEALDPTPVPTQD